MGVTHGDPKKVNAKGLLSWVSLTTLACSAMFMEAYGLIVAPRDILLHGQQHQQCLMIG